MKSSTSKLWRVPGATFFLTVLVVSASAKEPVPTGTLSGHIVDAGRRPVAGARVVLRAYDRDEKRDRLTEAISDAAGHFQLGPVEAVYRHGRDLRIEAEGFALQYLAAGSYSVFPDSDNDLGAISVHRGRVFTGQVLDVDGSPRADAEIEYSAHRHESGHSSGPTTPVRSLTVDAQGRFRTAPLPVGHLYLLVRAPDRQLAWRAPPILPGGEEELAPIQLENDVPIVGTVKDDQGAPVVGIELRANTDCRATTDGEGKFVLHGFGPNPKFQLQIYRPGLLLINWGVKGSDEGYRWHEVSDDSDKEFGPFKQLDIVMRPTASIEGKAIDADTGEPVLLDQVVLCFFERSPTGEVILNGCRASNFKQPEPGHFQVEYSRPDEYHLTLSAQGYEDAEAFTPKVTQLQKIDGIVVKMKKKTADAPVAATKPQFSGAVTRQGVPVKSGWVGLWAIGSRSDAVNVSLLRGRTVTEPPIVYESALVRDGVYTIEVPFQDEQWYLVAEEAGQPLTQIGPISIASKEQKQVDIPCVVGGSIIGRVDNVPAEWAGHLWALAFTKTGIRERAPVDTKGGFSFAQLPPGEYGLKVGHDAFEDDEVPRGKLSADDFKKLADPWRRARVVTVKAGQGEVVDLALPPK